MGFHEEYADHIRNHGEHLGETFTSGGPKAIFEEIEEMVPESWREQVTQHPLAALLVGLAAGLFIGIRVGDEVIAAGTTMVTAAAATHARNLVSSITERANRNE